MALRSVTGSDAALTDGLASVPGLELSRYWQDGPAVLLFLRHFG